VAPLGPSKNITPSPATKLPDPWPGHGPILTSDEYVASLEAKAARKQALLEESRVRKIAAEDSKEQRRLQKLEKL
jgi:hypothetical protein